MESMEDLLELQKKTGETIQNIIRNFKKDSAVRKQSSEYFEERLRRLQESWDEFQATDSKIRDNCDDPMKLEYFAESYYDKIKKVVVDYVKLFSEEAKRLRAQPEENAKAVADNSELFIPKQSYQQHNAPQDVESSSSTIRRLDARLSALARLLRGLTSTDDHPLQYYELNIGTINRLWAQIETLHDEAHEQLANPAAFGLKQAEYDEVHDLMQISLVNLSVEADKLKQSVAHKQNEKIMPTATSTSTVHLPKLTIPKFDGDYLKWRQFHDLFSEMVDKQPISAIQKMWYLKNNLLGEAEHLISQFSLSETNYSAAWETLKDRYNNKRILVANLVDKILNQPPVTSTASSIKVFHDTIKECLLALNNLGIATSSWDAILIQLLYKKLDKNIHIRYIQSLTNPRDVPTITEFLSFLEFQFQSLEAVVSKEKPIHKGVSTIITSNKTNNTTCRLCNNSDHKLYHCSNFLQLSEVERLRWVQRQGLCVNCFGIDHGSKTCNASSCRKCEKKHNTLLHLEKKGNTRTCKVHPKTFTKSPTVSTPLSNTAAAASASVNASGGRQGYVLLATAKIIINAPNGSSGEFRAILDSGSQVNLISNRIIQNLSISPIEASLCIDGIGKTQKRSHYRVNLKMMSKDSSFTTNFEAYVLPSIVPPQPDQHIDISTWNIPSNIPLADPQFHKQGNIDVLLGAEFFYRFMRSGTIRLRNNLPILQNTVLGWIVGGTIKNYPCLQKQRELTCAIFNHTASLEETIEQLWKLDEVQTDEKLLSPADRLCELNFNQHVHLNQEGRFVVRIPFRENPSVLGDSHTAAYNRFLALERRLSKDKQLQSQYVQFMREYEELGHMQRVSIDTVEHPRYFIPHHCVQKPDSSTTKLRVVFDASAKTSSGYSLNDLMYAGPTVQSELFSILLRFRLKRFVFTTDIQKMYRQILVNSDDHQYQLIIWRDDPKLPISYFKLKTITYGTRAAPYLATRCLQRIAEENTVNYPYGAQFLKDNFYVDDGLGGSDHLGTAIKIQEELITILRTHGLQLKKWCANHPLLLKNIPLGDQEVNLDFTNNKCETVKTLGLSWHPKSDHLRIKAKLTQNQAVTKRTATSDLAKVFDPIGLLAPVVVRAKIFIQHLWQQKMEWDDLLPENLKDVWDTFRTDLDNLNNMEIPRHIYKGEISTSSQLHVFADASEKAFGAAAYLRATLKDGRIIVHLLCAKSRVAPLKQQTLPRLELCAAVLAAQLSQRIKTDLQITNQSIYLWTDSEIVLSWINTQSTLYNTFVANRVATIQSLTITDQWRHVASQNNPADIISRGISANKLRECSLWFYGPLFLHGKEEMWPAKFIRPIVCDNEQRKSKTLAISTVLSDEFIYKIQHGNSFRRLQRILGYVIRFIKNTKLKKTDRPTQRALTPVELDDSLFIIVKFIQKTDFSSEIKQLKKHAEIDKKSVIISLTPFLDKEGILRVGGRLEASNLSYDAKHPMLLPYNDPLIKLLFVMNHVENNHCGPQALLNITRQRFWPIKGKILARSTVQHCITCAKMRPKLCKQLMGNLPQVRVTPVRPFINTGVDYCGPFSIHYKIRGKKPTKAYIAIFCCFSTKAVHLELVSDLTTESFIGALKRFTSRRGHCQNIYSDNATNFIGAKNQLSELKNTIYSKEAQELIASTASKKGVHFHFIPPRAPHFGGLWEAAVKSAKHLLLRSMSTACVTYEELHTIITEIEAILNSRPLTPMSENPNDLQALTPGHFLIGEALTSQIDSKATTSNVSNLAHWKLLSHLKQEFWKRWSSEYLNELQQRYKWNKSCTNVRIGDMVVVKEDNVPVMKWPLARITQTYPGEDGIVRVAEVKTSSGLFKRPIHRLALLPIDSESSETVSNKPEVSAKDGPESSVEPQAKRPKYINPHISLTVLALLFMFQLAFGVPIINERFEKGIGLHFEQFGIVTPSNSEWNIVVYYDLRPYWDETSTFVKSTKDLQSLCQIMRPSTFCFKMLRYFKNMEIDLQLENRLIRSKRGALDIVGNVANSLFGVLDSEYAKQMSETVSKVQENESYLLKLLKNQTSVVDSTINIIKQNQLSTKDKFDHIKKDINTYTESINQINSTIVQLQLSQLLTSAVLELNFMANNLLKIQSSILDTLIDTHHGKINPQLLSPQQLESAISQIKDHLPPSLRFPVGTGNNLLTVFKLMKLKGSLTHQHAIFKITLPLIDYEEFKLFYITPVPNAVNNTLVSIKPCARILGINTDRKQFIVLSTLKLNTCEVMTSDIFLCTNIQIRYTYESEMCSCDIKLFNNKTASTCNIERVNSKWISLNKKNQWIYASTSSSQATAVCDKEIIPIKIKGSGLLTLEPECMLRHDSVTITGKQTISAVVKSSYTSFGMDTNMSLIQSLTNLPSNNQSNSSNIEALYETNLKQLDFLQKTLQDNKFMELPNKLSSHQTHSYTIGYLALIVSIITIFIAIIKFRGMKTSTLKNSAEPNMELHTNHTPVPTPRKRPVFSFDV